MQDNAWGHHASCTCPIGPANDPNAVLDSNFRVYGTSNLRVVDASVFPKIPGFFIVSCVYMIGEKASDAILAAAGHAKLPRCLYGEGFWCKLWKPVKSVACCLCCLLGALKPVGKVLAGVVGAVAAALVLIVAAKLVHLRAAAGQSRSDQGSADYPVDHHGTDGEAQQAI